MFDAIVYLRKLDGDGSPDDLRAVQSVGKSFGIPVYDNALPTPDPVHMREVLFVPFGGDGTMLAAMRSAAQYADGSVFGMNAGRLGFLTNPGEMEYFESYLASLCTGVPSWERDRRMLINAKVRAYNHPLVAANEFLLTTPTRKDLLEYDIFINDRFVAKHRGDGVIVTTATGSTAYAMSAGGAIMAPTSRAMQIVPLAPHTLTARPIIVSEDDTIMVRGYRSERNSRIELVTDGHQELGRYTDEEQTYLDTTITKYKFVTVWRQQDWNFFDVLNKKMGWGI